MPRVATEMAKSGLRTQQLIFTRPDDTAITPSRVVVLVSRASNGSRAQRLPLGDLAVHLRVRFALTTDCDLTTSVFARSALQLGAWGPRFSEARKHEATAPSRPVTSTKRPGMTITVTHMCVPPSWVPR